MKQLTKSKFMFRRLIRRKTLTKDLTFLNMEQGKKYRELTTDPIEYDVKKHEQLCTSNLRSVEKWMRFWETTKCQGW